MKNLIACLLITSLPLVPVVHAGDTAPPAVEFLNAKPASPRLPFSDAVRVDHTLYLSGQIGLDPRTKQLAEGGFAAEAHQTLSNIQRTLTAHGYGMENIVKCTVMLTDIGDFKAFNAIYTKYFTPPYPSRSAFAVNELALGASVEVECLAVTARG